MLQSGAQCGLVWLCFVTPTSHPDSCTAARPPDRLSSLIFRSPRSHLTSAMNALSLLGFVKEIPARFTVDPAHPRSLVSEAFLFQHRLNPVLDSSGCNHQRATLSIPSLGGYYTAPDFLLQCSVACRSDVVLGADWLSQCHPTTNGNAFGWPPPEIVANLPEGHTWTANGTHSLG